MPVMPQQWHKQYQWLPLLIIFIATLSLTGGTIALLYVESYLVGMAGETLALAATEIADKLNQFLHERHADAQLLSRAPIFHGTNTAAMTQYLMEVKSSNSYLWVGVTDASGRIIAASDPPSVGEDHSESAWFQRVRDTGRICVASPDPSEEFHGIESVAVTAPMKGQDGKFRGALTMRIGLSDLEGILTKTVQSVHLQSKFLGQIHYQFVDANGRAFIDSDLAYKGNVDLVTLGLPSALAVHAGKPGFVQERDARRHVPVLTGYAALKEQDDMPALQWGILVRMDRDDVLAPTRTILLKLGALGGLVFIPLLGVLFWMTIRLRKEWVKAQFEGARAQQAESQYRLLLESTGEGIYGIDREGRCTFINKAAAAMLGYRPDEVIGKDMHALHHHSYGDGAPYRLEDCPIYGAFRTGQHGCITDEVLWRRDGTSFPAEYAFSPILDDGVILGAVVRFVDISSRQQADEAIRLHGEILNNMAEGVCLVRAKDAAIIYANPTFEGLFGYSPGELIGQPMSVVHAPSPSTPDESVRGIVETLKRAGTWKGEMQNTKKDGTPFWCEANVSVFEHLHLGVVWVAVLSDITERKRAQQAVETSERRLQAIMEYAPVAIFLKDMQGRYTLINRQCEAFLSRTKVEVLGKTDYEIFDKATAVRLGAQNVTVLETGVAVQFEETIQQGDGPHHYLSVRFLLTEAADCPFALCGMATDVTQHRRAEDALRESEEKFRSLVETTKDWIWSIDREGRITYSNPAVESILMYTPGELDGQDCFGFMHEEDRAQVAEWLPRAMAEKRGWSDVVVRWRHKEGTYRWLESSAVPILDEHGELIGYRGVDHDITARRRAESALQENNALLHGVFESAPDAMVVVDHAGRISRINGQAVAVFGYSRGELVEQPIEILLPERFRGRHSDHRAGYLSRPSLRPMGGGLELFALRKDGREFPADIMLSPMETRQGSFVIAIIRDITARKSADEALRKSEEFGRTVLNSLPAHIAVLDRQGYIQAVNDSWKEFARENGLLVPNAIALGANYLEAFRLASEQSDPPASDAWAGIHAVLDGTCERFTREYPCHSSSSQRWVLLIAARLSSKDGGAVISYIDLTERKLAELALRETEERFRLVVRATNDVIWDRDLISGKVWWNERYQELFGYRADEIDPAFESWSNRIHPDDRGRVFAGLHANIANGHKYWSDEYRLSTASGLYADVYDRGYVAYDEAGKPARMVGAMMDMTERKRVQAALSESERQLRQALDEREQLSQDLHDNIIQSIYAVGLSIEECQHLLQPDVKDVDKRLSRAIVDLNRVIRDVRNYIAGDTSDVITAKELREQLSRLTQNIKGADALRFRLRIDPLAVKLLTPDEARHILFIAHEAMSNALRHAQAKRGYVSIRMKDDGVRLEVKDDGIGFRPNDIPEGHGLRNITARALKLHARLQVISEAGFGTLIILDLPKENCHDANKL